MPVEDDVGFFRWMEFGERQRRLQLPVDTHEPDVHPERGLQRVEDIIAEPVGAYACHQGRVMPETCSRHSDVGAVPPMDFLKVLTERMGAPTCCPLNPRPTWEGEP